MFTSNLSASGSTATVAADVCIRPCVSVEGTRCTRWTPDSYFKIPYTPAPATAKSISLNPPTVPSETDVIDSVQPFLSQYRLYILKISPANNAASSPPAPALISICTFLSSSGSLGTSKSLISSSSFGCNSSFSLSSILAISFISGSVSLARISLASDIVARQFIYRLRAFIISPRSLYSLVSFTYRCWSLITSGSVMSVETSSKRASSPSSFFNILFSSGISFFYCYFV